MACNPRFCLEGPHSKNKDGSQEEVSQKPQTMQQLPMYRCKYTSNAEIESRGLYNFCETLLVFEDSEARGRMRNKWEIEIWINACFSALNHAKRLMSVEQSIKSTTSQAIFYEN